MATQGQRAASPEARSTVSSATIEVPAMVKTEREYREDICQIGRLVFQKGWVAANDGNITIRLDAERILATPTGVCKGMMHPDDLIIVDMKGNKISGPRRAHQRDRHAHHGLRPAAGYPRRGARASAGCHRLRHGRASR